MAVSITKQERARRQREVENALASVRMEGLEPPDDAKALFQRYVDGELTSDALEQAFDQQLNEKYGPVRLPRNERS